MGCRLLKTRTNFTISERELITALAANGRNLTLKEIGLWRRNGLLPPMSSHGHGQGKGRTHCWHDAGVIRQAEITHDMLARHCRVDAAILILWLSGSPVSLPQLRRAWLCRHRMRRPVAICAGNSNPRHAIPDLEDGLSNWLLQMMLALGDSVQPEEIAHHAMAVVLSRALQKLGLIGRATNHGHADQVWKLVSLMAVSLESSDLLRKASDEEMLDARSHLRAAIRVLQECADQPDMVMEQFGPTLFLLILALIHSGQSHLLQALQAERHAGRQADRPPAHASQI